MPAIARVHVCNTAMRSVLKHGVSFVGVLCFANKWYNLVEVM